MKEYVKSMKEYEEICQYIEFGTPISIWALGLEKFRAPPSDSLWDLEKFRILPLYMGLGTWKYSTPELPLPKFFISHATYIGERYFLHIPFLLFHLYISHIFLQIPSYIFIIPSSFFLFSTYFLLFATYFFIIIICD